MALVLPVAVQPEKGLLKPRSTFLRSLLASRSRALLSQLLVQLVVVWPCFLIQRLGLVVEILFILSVLTNHQFMVSLEPAIPVACLVLTPATMHTLETSWTVPNELIKYLNSTTIVKNIVESSATSQLFVSN